MEGVFSHFATADEADTSYAQRQFAAFTEVLSRLDGANIPIPIKHIANSAAALTEPRTELSLVRSGIAIYGLSPVSRKPESLQLSAELGAEGLG